MRVTKTESGRKLIAVIGVGGSGIWLNDGRRPVYVARHGTAPSRVTDTSSLERLAEHQGRTPVYEGDTITIQF